MKKISIVTACFFALVALTFVACHDVIFDTIRDEVELEDAQVQGDINSIVRYQLNGTEYLFVQNGTILYKNVSENPTSQEPYHGGWQTFPKGAMTHVVKLAADSTYLYALDSAVDYDDDEDWYVTNRLFYYDPASEIWTLITLDEAETTSSAVTLFCTNAPQNDHRKAFVRFAKRLYALDGATATDVTDTYSTNDLSANTDTTKTTDDDGNEISTTTQTTAASSCAYFGGSYYFAASTAMITNETAEDDASYIYYAANTDNIYYTQTPDDSESWQHIDLSLGTIHAMSFTSDYIILGTDSGYEHALLVADDNGTVAVPTTTTSSLPVNAESALSSAYEIHNVLAVNPALSEIEGDLYATATFDGSTSSSSATRSKEGLWAYYPGRSEWNLE